MNAITYQVSPKHIYRTLCRRGMFQTARKVLHAMQWNNEHPSIYIADCNDEAYEDGGLVDMTRECKITNTNYGMRIHL